MTTTKDPTQWIVVYGNPIDGLSFVGPFAEPDHADGWADENIRQEEYWIAELGDPESVAKET